MIEKFITKRDINGNTYTLIIDHEKKTVKRDYNPYHKDDFVVIGKREKNRLFDMCISNGYTSI